MTLQYLPVIAYQSREWTHSFFPLAMLVRWRGWKKAPLLAAGSGLMSGVEGVEGEEEGLPFLAQRGKELY
jgi:hypothetical protein